MTTYKFVALSTGKVLFPGLVLRLSLPASFNLSDKFLAVIPVAKLESSKDSGDLAEFGCLAKVIGMATEANFLNVTIEVRTVSGFIGSFISLLTLFSNLA